MELDLPIVAERLILRERVASDARALADLANDGRVSRNLGPTFPYPYTLADAEAFLALPMDTFAIQLAGGAGDLIGMIGSAGPAARFGVVSFGYWLGVPYWGRGYATEAVRAYVAAVAAVPEVRRVEASVYDWNPASARVLEKAGFTLEGRRIARGYVRGEIGDELEYGLLT